MYILSHTLKGMYMHSCVNRTLLNEILKFWYHFYVGRYVGGYVQGFGIVVYTCIVWCGVVWYGVVWCGAV